MPGMEVVKKATSLANKLIRSEYKGEFGKDTCKYKGTYMCGSCGYCRHMYTVKKKHPNEWTHF